jgi:glycosyltransferase involved in cell wall biosynthesis
MKPLVSILIPAFNGEETLPYTLESALGQTWQRKEIIVIDDGSTDGTANVARRFTSKELTVVSTENRGLSGAVNSALRLCQGDYIQELDADDILASDKIERQMSVLSSSDSSELLLSCPWASFYYRTSRARFVRNSLWNDLSPVEWLLRKMGENLHMQNATWLVSREIIEKAGPWDESLSHDQDGEYFCRVLIASEGTRFVPDARVYYRSSGTNRVSFVGNSPQKQDSLFRSIKLHIQYLRSLEDSERVRRSCLVYLQNWLVEVYPDRADLVAEFDRAASELGGRLEPPTLRWKYDWMRPVIGSRAALRAQRTLPEFKGLLLRHWDRALWTLGEWSSNETAPR